MTTDELMGLTLPELDRTVTAAIRADRLSVDAVYLEALDAAVLEDGELDGAAMARALGGIRGPEQLERIIGQLDREQERHGAWLDWLERCALAMRDRVDDEPMGEDARPLADELAAIMASWPEAPRVRVA